MIAGIRLNTNTRKANPNSRPGVSPVISVFAGLVSDFHGMMRPMNMNDAKFRNRSSKLLNESCRTCTSARKRPSQFNALPAAKHAKVSSAPKQPQVPTMNI